MAGFWGAHLITFGVDSYGNPDADGASLIKMQQDAFKLLNE
jgi:hypothetical protein